MPADEAKETRQQVIKLRNLMAGFHIRKWILNEAEVITLCNQVQVVDTKGLAGGKGLG